MSSSKRSFEDWTLALAAAATAGFATGHLLVPGKMTKMLYVDKVPEPAATRTGIIAAGTAAGCALIASGNDRGMKKNMLKVATAGFLVDSATYLRAWRKKTQPETVALVHTGMAAAFGAVCLAGVLHK